MEVDWTNHVRISLTFQELFAYANKLKVILICIAHLLVLQLEFLFRSRVSWILVNSMLNLDQLKFCEWITVAYILLVTPSSSVQAHFYCFWRTRISRIHNGVLDLLLLKDQHITNKKRYQKWLFSRQWYFCALSKEPLGWYWII